MFQGHMFLTKSITITLALVSIAVVIEGARIKKRTSPPIRHGHDCEPKPNGGYSCRLGGGKRTSVPDYGQSTSINCYEESGGRVTCAKKRTSPPSHSNNFGPDYVTPKCIQMEDGTKACIAKRTSVPDFEPELADCYKDDEGKVYCPPMKRSSHLRGSGHSTHDVNKLQCYRMESGKLACIQKRDSIPYEPVLADCFQSADGQIICPKKKKRTSYLKDDESKIDYDPYEIQCHVTESGEKACIAKRTSVPVPSRNKKKRTSYLKDDESKMDYNPHEIQCYVTESGEKACIAKRTSVPVPEEPQVENWDHPPRCWIREDGQKACVIKRNNI